MIKLRNAAGHDSSATARGQHHSGAYTIFALTIHSLLLNIMQCVQTCEISPPRYVKVCLMEGL